MKKILSGIIVTLMVAIGAGTWAAPAVYAADPTDAAKAEICDGVTGQTGGKCSQGDADIKKVLRAVVWVLSIVAGIIAVIMIVVAGLKFITSGGDAQGVAGARRALIYAIVGLLVVAMAQVMVRYVLKAVN